LAPVPADYTYGAAAEELPDPLDRSVHERVAEAVREAAAAR
jgi:hypothetical protein